MRSVIWRRACQARLMRALRRPLATLRSPGVWLHRQPLAHFALDHVLALARQHDGAAVHHRIVVGEIARPLEILLDDENGEVAALLEIDDRPADVANDRR